MSTQILRHPTFRDWIEVKNDCRNTMGKEATSNEPSEEWKRKLLISEHSPIREIRIKWRWENIKYWIVGHWVRHHEGVEKWVSTSRTDRTGVNRDELRQDNPVDINMEANAQACINMGKVRLCYQAAPETREYMEDLKRSIYEVEPMLSECLVPSCIYRGGCPEFKPCGFYEKIVSRYAERNNISMSAAYEAASDISTRYEMYNSYFWRFTDDE